MRERTSWQQEIEDAVRHENWSLYGWNRVVKVVRRLPTGIGTLASQGHEAPPGRLGGYITVASAIHGCTPWEIQVKLGLPDYELADGALIYRFLRLPSISEYDYELTAEHPDGLAFTYLSDERYPPGSRQAPQWRIKDNVDVPVDTNNVVTLMPEEKFDLEQWKTR